ncbi:elongation factor G [Fulvitalea axinellae]|uniref:Elongation factor G n=1 Tax=Fulvitalea axinellae TaxID=1182444 RepID=A0AAU9CL16_9BACT|nr:elongation factor G [Fulvitalea axinellae]
MKTFDQKHIKNIVLLGSSKSGKTTLAETMLYEAGMTDRRGSVEGHNTVSDYHEIERERGFSVYATSMHTEWRDYKINIFDTPGVDDFAGEVVSSVRVADTCLIMVNAKAGVEVGDQLVWEYINIFNKPTIFVINQLDHAQSDFSESWEDVRYSFGPNAVLMQYPVNEGEGFDSIIDLLKMVMYKFPEGGGKPQKLPIPEDEREKADRLHNVLVERAAENDEGLMGLYFEKGELNEDEMRLGLRIGMANHDVFPVFCVSAEKNMGSGRLMGFIDNVAPSATDLKPEPLSTGEYIPYNLEGDPVAFVYKTVNEPYLGRVSFLKVISGELHPNMDLYNPDTDTMERIHQLYVMDGNERVPVQKFQAGDIGAVVKLKKTRTNDTLCLKESPVKVAPMVFPEPKSLYHVFSEKKEENEKLGEMIREIAEEDPTVEVEFDQETRELIVGLQGEAHLSVLEWKLKRLYNVEASFKQPTVPYRETIDGGAEVTYRHKKQSGGAGQFGEVVLRVSAYTEGMEEPPKEAHVREKTETDLPWGGKFQFYNCVVGGAIDQRFMLSIRKGVMEVMEEGVLAKSKIRDVRVMVMDGKMHPVDSNDISFKIAGREAFREAFSKSSPHLMEPLLDLCVGVPLTQVGEVMTDLQSRRAMIMGMEQEGNRQLIEARVPQAEMYEYANTLKSLTQGLGDFTWKFAKYSSVPAGVVLA